MPDPGPQVSLLRTQAGARYRPGGSANRIAPVPTAYTAKPVMRASAGSKACHAK